MKTDIIQKMLLLNTEGKILLLRRSKTDERRPSQWDIPGGQHEPGEEMIAGVKRELMEEAGITATDAQVVYATTVIRRWENNERNVVYLFYIAHTDSTDVTLSYEHSEFAWMTIDEALRIYEYPLHIAFLTYVRDNKLVL